MLPAIDPTDYTPTPVSYDEILKALTAGGFNCDRDGDGDPIVISEKNRIVFYSHDARTRSILLYSIFHGEEGSTEDKQNLADELSDEFDMPNFAINRDNLHIRLFISCIAGLNLPELYRATQLFCRDINMLEDDGRVQTLFPLERARKRTTGTASGIN